MEHYLRLTMDIDCFIIAAILYAHRLFMEIPPNKLVDPIMIIVREYSMVSSPFIFNVIVTMAYYGLYME